MANIISSIVVLLLWVFSIVCPIFITNNRQYLKEASNSSKGLEKARKDTHFLKQ